MPQMLEQLQFPICPFTEDRSREGFHDFLNGDRSARKLVLGGAV